MRTIPALLVIATLSACRLFGTDEPSIAGRYTLTSVDGGALPCCGQVDATTGARTTTLSGTLVLDAAAPEAFVTTPAGYYPSSCVHEVPNGARVGIGTYSCGDGDFSLTLVQRVDSADGASTTSSIVSAGRYAWSDHDGLIKLIDVPMLGTVTLGANRALQLQHVDVTGQHGPTYAFASR